MSWFSTGWQWLRDDEAGAITVDWVALSALAIVLGTATVYAIYSNGVSLLVEDVNGVTISASEIDVQPVPNMNNG